MKKSFKVAALALVLAAVSLNATPGHADPTPERQVVTLDVPSPLVDTNALGGVLTDPTHGLQVKVVLPAGYDDHPDTSYPVLYLLNGASSNADSYLNQLDITHLLGNVPAVIVLPDGGRYGMYTNWWNNGKFGGPDWVDYHLGTVRNLVEHDFRIRPGRRWHAIAGISMGGQGTLRYASMLPGYFGSAAALSPAVPDMRGVLAYAGVPVLVGIDASALVSYEEIWGPVTGNYAKANNPQELVGNLAHTRLYVASGNGINCTGDPMLKTFAVDAGTEAAIRLITNPYVAKAKKAGVDVTERQSCGVHTWPVWTRDFKDILARWDFFGPVPADPTSWTYKTGMQHGTMWQFDFAFTGQPGFDTFTRAGNELTGTGTGTVTLSTDGCTFTETLPFSRTLPSGCDPTMRD